MALEGDLEQKFIDYSPVSWDNDNHERYHKSLKNVISAGAYFGRAPDILKQKEKIKQNIIAKRRLIYQNQAGLN